MVAMYHKFMTNDDFTDNFHIDMIKQIGSKN